MVSIASLLSGRIEVVPVDEPVACRSDTETSCSVLIKRGGDLSPVLLSIEIGADRKASVGLASVFLSGFRGL